jgi:hypothetical protein
MTCLQRWTSASHDERWKNPKRADQNQSNEFGASSHLNDFTLHGLDHP